VSSLIAIAIAISTGASTSSARLEPARSKRQFPPRLRVALVVVALAGAAVQVPGLVSAQLVRGSADALADGDADEALSLADDAVRPPGRRARTRSGREPRRAAVADAATAVSHEPLEPAHRALEARLGN
jgi:hypothetical protein